MQPESTPPRTFIVRRNAKLYGEPSAALLELCRAALLARAETETVRPQIVAMQGQVLAENDYQVAGHWKEYGVPMGRITDPSGAYEMSEEQFAQYYAACAVAYRAAGFEFEDQQCPLSIAEDVQAKAEKAFGLACSELHTGIDPQQALELGDAWKEFLELMFQIVVPFLNPYQPVASQWAYRASRF